MEMSEEERTELAHWFLRLVRTLHEPEADEEGRHVGCQTAADQTQAVDEGSYHHRGASAESAGQRAGDWT